MAYPCPGTYTTTLNNFKIVHPETQSDSWYPKPPTQGINIQSGSQGLWGPDRNKSIVRHTSQSVEGRLGK